MLPFGNTKLQDEPAYVAEAIMLANSTANETQAKLHTEQMAKLELESKLANMRMGKR